MALSSVLTLLIHAVIAQHVLLINAVIAQHQPPLASSRAEQDRCAAGVRDQGHLQQAPEQRAPPPAGASTIQTPLW